MALFEFYVVFFCKLLSLCIVGNSVEIDAGVFLDAVDHSDALEGLAEVDLDAVVGDHGSTAYFLSQILEHALCELHHALVVGVCLVQLHQRKLRVMSGVNTLIAEYSADLVDSLQAAYDQSLQVQFQRDAKLHVLVQCVVVSLKGSCGSAACIGYQHRCLHFHEVSRIQEVTDLLDDLGSLDKGLPGLCVHDQVHISLAITGVGIGQSVEFLGQDLEALGQHGHLHSMNGYLAGHGAEYISLYSIDISDIRFLEICICICSNCISCNIYLNIALQVTDIAEGCLPHNPLEHHTACDRYLNRLSVHDRSSLIVVLLQDLFRLLLIQSSHVRLLSVCKQCLFVCNVLCNRILCMSGHIIFCNLKRILSCLLQGCQLFPSHLQKLIHILIVLCFCHFLYLAFFHEIIFT